MLIDLEPQAALFVILGDLLLWGNPVFIKPTVICEILSALEPGKWADFRAQVTPPVWKRSYIPVSPLDFLMTSTFLTHSGQLPKELAGSFTHELSLSSGTVWG